jgi:hypothetical protein
MRSNEMQNDFEKFTCILNIYFFIYIVKNRWQMIISNSLKVNIQYFTSSDFFSFDCRWIYHFWRGVSVQTVTFINEPFWIKLFNLVVLCFSVFRSQSEIVTLKISNPSLDSNQKLFSPKFLILEDKVLFQ